MGEVVEEIRKEGGRRIADSSWTLRQELAQKISWDSKPPELPARGHEVLTMGEKKHR